MDKKNLFKVQFADTFLKSFNRLDKSNQRIILKYVENHMDNVFIPTGAKPLKSNLKGLYKFRVAGNYRIIAKVESEELIILALYVGHRSTVYKDFDKINKEK